MVGVAAGPELGDRGQPELSESGSKPYELAACHIPETSLRDSTAAPITANLHRRTLNKCGKIARRS